MIVAISLHLLSAVIWVGGMFFAPFRRLRRALAGVSPPNCTWRRPRRVPQGINRQ